jgi:hypothetical protein
MYDKNSSLEETELFLSSPKEMIQITYVMCETLFLGALNNCHVLGANRPSDLTDEKINEYEAYLN